MSGSKVKKSAESINSLACFNEWDTAGAKRLKYPAREARQTSSGRLRACPGVVYFDKNLLNEAVEKYKNSKFVEDCFRDITDADILIDKVIGLKEDEKNYKKGLKDHYDAFIVQEHGYRQGFWTQNNGIENIKKTSMYKDLEKESRGSKILIYTSLEDFEIA